MENMIRPFASSSDIASTLTDLYSIEIRRLKQLDGYDDLNYLVEGIPIDDCHMNKYVCKVLNSEDSHKTDCIEAQHRLMEYLNKRGINVSIPVINVKGQYYSIETFGGNKHLFRLLRFVEGTKLNDTIPCAQLYYNVGLLAGKLYSALEIYKDDILTLRKTLWMLESVPKILDYLHAVPNVENRELVIRTEKEFEERVLPIIPDLEKGVCHGDLNEHNILVDGSDVVGLIDFGDASYGPVLFEIAIALTYMILHSRDISVVKDVLLGYRSYRQLTNLETNLIKVCVCARLAQSLVLGCYSALKAPNNEYVLSSQKHGWTLFKQLSAADDSQLKTLWGLDD